MPYYLVATRDDNYQLIEGSKYFVEFNAGEELIRIFKKYLEDIEFTYTLISLRIGKGKRKEALFKMQFKDFRIPTSYIYAFQTESGGRWNSIAKGMGEARIQWRTHDQWTPDLKSLSPAIQSCQGLEEASYFANCFIFTIYKRHFQDDDIIISAAYPTQAQDVEINSKSNKSIQFKIEDIRNAYLHGMSATEKSNDEYIVHFRPDKLLWYMQNRDLIHNGSSLYLHKILKKIISR